jgi:hypothetical protein
VGAFGEKLRKLREQRGIELDAISNTTKISTRMLRALEDEHFDQLPGGVFNKGFVRAYARLVGLDEEEAIADYLAALRESQIQAQSILPDFRSPAGKPDTVAVREAPNSTIRREVPPGNNGTDDRGKSDPGKTDYRKTDPLKNDHRKNDYRNRDLRNRDLRKSDLRENDLRQNDPPKNDPRGSASQEKDRRRQGRRSEDRLAQELSSSPDISDHAVAPERLGSKHVAGSPAQASDHPSSQVPWGKLAGALLLVALTLAVWNSRRHGETTTASHAAAASNATPPSPQPAAPTSTQLSLATPASHPVSSLTVAKAAPAANVLSAGKVTQPAPLTLSGTVSPPSGAGARTPASGTSSITNTPTKAAENSPEPRVDRSDAGSSALAAAGAPTNTFTVLIRAEKTTWVSIVADGKPFAQETLIAPANTSVRASREVVVKTGNAAGVSFLLNGKEIPAEGSEGEVRTYVFDAHTVRIVPQPQAPTPIP